jgi:hypothetical protein
MKRKLESTGAFQILTEDKYLTGPTYLKRGDILCKPGSHVVMVLDDGAKAVHMEENIPVYYSVRLPQLAKGMKGDAVKVMQQLLLAKGYELPKFGADGDFGAETENALLLYQEDMSIKPNAKCDPDTWSALLGLTGVG